MAGGWSCLQVFSTPSAAVSTQAAFDGLAESANYGVDRAGYNGAAIDVTGGME